MTDTAATTDPPILAWLAALILLLGATSFVTFAMWLGELAPGWLPLASVSCLVALFVVACVTVAVYDRSSRRRPAEGVGGLAED